MCCVAITVCASAPDVDFPDPTLNPACWAARTMCASATNAFTPRLTPHHVCCVVATISASGTDAITPRPMCRVARSMRPNGKMLSHLTHVLRSMKHVCKCNGGYHLNPTQPPQPRVCRSSNHVCRCFQLELCVQHGIITPFPALPPRMLRSSTFRAGATDVITSHPGPHARPVLWPTASSH